MRMMMMMMMMMMVMLLTLEGRDVSGLYKDSVRTAL